MRLFKKNRERVEELKRKYEINNERHAAAHPEEATTPAEPPVEVAEPQENWIWVEGYKGTNKDMKAYGNFQYELGKQYDHEGEIEICDRGFHFCRYLKDVFNYYEVDEGHRFFKVKALVKESDYEKYGEYIRVSIPSFWGGGTTLSNERVNKLVAKSIILEEEVSKTEIIMAYYQHEPRYKKLPEEYWDTIIRNGHSAAYADYKVDTLIKAGYSPVFARCIYQDGKAEKALTIADQEGVSMDMKVWYIYH
jgi:hypothetical protein